MSPPPRFVRPNYVDGQMLTAADYRAEQDYHRGKARLQNRLLFGIGVVAGLRVSVSNGELTVSPGLAYDCQGNELLLTEVHRSPIPEDLSLHFVTLRHSERAVEWQPVLDPVAPIDEAPAVATLVEEIVEVSLDRALAHLPHRDPLSRVFGCEAPHAVCLALIHWNGKRWSVRPSARTAVRR